MELVKLFEPITIRNMVVKNRIVMPAMGLAYTGDYTFNERFEAFYRERAEGGVGLMTIGPLAIDRVGSAPFMPGLFLDENVERIGSFVDALHRETDVKLATQLFHMGRYAFSAVTGMTPIAPSPVRSKLTGETPREMTLEDIREVQDAFAEGARRAREAGFDFIEILACTGYLISQFLSPVTNRREDEYGGSLENRMRFGLEVIQRVRRAVGPETAVGIRIAGHDFMEGGNTNVEAARFAAEAEKAGVDAVNVTGGWHETQVPQLTTNVPPGNFVYLARGVKRAVSVPVFASNRLGDPFLAERALRAGNCDMICWARPLIADPMLPEKARTGRFEEIVPCIACNQECFDAIFSGGSVSCVMNPRAGREAALRVEPAPRPKKILVAGGGPGGMEFAVTAARRGHRVILCEKEKALGGQVNLARVPPGKADFGNVVRSLAGRMKASGVEVRLGTPVTLETVRSESPDLVVVATGAVPAALPVPGVDLPHVVQAWDVLADRVVHIGDHVVVVGGSATGCETAHTIAAMGAPDPSTLAFLMAHGAETPQFMTQMIHESGRDITVIDMVPRFADNVGKTFRWSLLKSLKLAGVKLKPRHRLVEIRPGEVLAEKDGERITLKADTVVLATGSLPEDRLVQELEGSGVPLILLGDAKAPRKLTDAVREGFEEALKI
ncbi:MAG: FAD-dependent oxidoreductase [Deltaproteobacteria bacterium]|nr:FAD-dependent oxidoreductase [Deltaproteobacteria bacterium]MBW1949289.1 FAD-dependent oxidoreductase [Deltaproteobacteria bacterium]MBW2007723.1 FAD-dependent oxidoreductase [Deltaproteobacteria bacterium]